MVNAVVASYACSTFLHLNYNLAIASMEALLGIQSSDVLVVPVDSYDLDATSILTVLDPVDVVYLTVEDIISFLGTVTNSLVLAQEEHT